jgi:hypothetical protein
MSKSSTAFNVAELGRKARHAEVAADSNKRRQDRNAPRRDDIARVVLFITLMQYRGSKHDGARAVVRTAILDLLADAGYSREEAGAAFDAMVPRVGTDLDGYFIKRKVDDEIWNTWRTRNGMRPRYVLSAADRE